MAMRVLVVADAPVLRAGLAACLVTPDCGICGEASGASEALALARRQQPDIVIAEVSVNSGLDLLRRLQAEQPRVPVIAWCPWHEGLLVERALRAGARAVLGRSATFEQVRAACRRVCAGKVYLSEGLAERMLERLAARGPADGGGVDLLTDRELEVFSLFGQGLSTVAIAGRLNLSIKTVECLREKIKRKLGLTGAAALMHRAVQWSLQAG